MNEESRWDEICTDLKLEINKVLWTYLPANTTIGEAENLACDFADKIHVLYLRQPDNFDETKDKA